MVLRALMRWCHLKWAGVAALLVLNVQCGVPNQNSEPKIYGGSKTPLGGWNIVVALTLQNKGIYCTGTAITPQLIVTAAHCLKGENPRNISVYVGSGAEEGRAIGQYQVHKMAINPLYEGEFSEGYDFGYIVLGQPLPLSASEYVEPLIDLNEIDEMIKVGEVGRAVGFGVRESGAFGVKYQMDASVVSVGELEFKLGGGGKDTCQGDSGGPVFQQVSRGGWRFVGVTSRGGRCGTGGVYGLVHKNICWISHSSGIDLGLPSGYCS